MHDVHTQGLQHRHTLGMEVTRHGAHAGLERLRGLVAWRGAEIEETLAR